MPSHQQRREPLPKDYQFGDAALSYEDTSVVWREGDTFTVDMKTGLVVRQQFTHNLFLRAQGEWKP
jgi:hypothetical protein